MKTISLSTFVLIFCANVFSADKFELLVEARIPSLMTSAQNLTSLSENVLPGSSGIIGVAVASLAFNPKLAVFDLTSPIQILGFGSKIANKKELLWCIAMYPKDKNNPTMQIDDKQKTIFVKGIGDRAVLSYHKELIGSIIEIPATDEKDEYDVKFVFYPRKYLDLFPDGISSLKKEITELALKKSGRSDEDLNNIKIFSIKMTELEKAVCQFSKTDLNINFKKDRITIKSEFLPAEGSSAVSFIKAQTKTNSIQKSCDTGTGTLISYGNINITDRFKNEIIQTLKEILIETADNYDPEISDFLSELIKSFSGEFRYKMDSFAPGSVSCLEMSSSDGKCRNLKDFISESKKIKEVKKGIYSFNPENADMEKYNSFVSLNEKWSKIVYGKTKMSSIEKLITEGISSGTENQTKGDISIYVFSDNGKNDRKPLFNSIFTFNENTLTIDTDIFEEGIKKAVPANLIPKKRQEKSEN
jgi:hypothetical protein